LATERPPRAKITLVYFDAGGGHRSVMNALCAVIWGQRRPWEIECLNFQQLLDPLDPIRKIAGVRTQDVYNHLLRTGWTLGSTQLLPILHALIKVHHSRIVHLLEGHWWRSQPDVVVSLIPHFNRQLAESVRKALPGHPFVTILTDLADYPPHFWIEPESEYLICGTERAAQQALAMGHAPERVFTTSGMIVNPAFYANEAWDRRQDRLFLGLAGDRMTGLVFFGGHGSYVMLEIARELNTLDNLQLIFISGRNLALARELERVRFHNPVHLEGFTTQVPYYMRLSDFLVGKPGPGSISEALVMGLPAVVECNAWTLPQERFNAEWIKENDLGIVVRSFRHVGEAVEQLLEPSTLARFRENALALRNRAVFEVPDMLEAIIQENACGAFERWV
jgi:1,2-diacylglycerol 3-beta-galactosyltransferase